MRINMIQMMFYLFFLETQTPPFNDCYSVLHAVNVLSVFMEMIHCAKCFCLRPDQSFWIDLSVLYTNILSISFDYPGNLCENFHFIVSGWYFKKQTDVLLKLIVTIANVLMTITRKNIEKELIAHLNKIK